MWNFSAEEKMTTGVICEAISEIVSQCPGVNIYAAHKFKHCGHLCVIIDLSATLYREDGHHKSTVIGVVEWSTKHNKEYMSVRHPEESKLSSELIPLAKPTFLNDLKECILQLRTKACHHQGNGGNKKRRRNKLKWR